MEIERLNRLPRDVERETVSVGYARGYGFYFGLVHVNDDELAARAILREEMRRPPTNGFEPSAAAIALRGDMRSVCDEAGDDEPVFVCEVEHPC